MRWHWHIPAPPLSNFVALLWLSEGNQQPHKKERLLPNGSMELVVNLTARESVVVGAHSRFFVIDTAEPQSIIGAHFRAGGAFPFFGLPAGELHNTLVSLEDLWGAEAAVTLRDRLLEAATPRAMFQVLKEALTARASRRLERHPAVDYALREFHAGPHKRTIAEVTGQIGLSPKRFIERFTGEVGLTPKLFCRIRRFQRVVRLVQNAQPVDWAGVAADCGYFDQSHFIHDFHAFSGLNPATYLTLRTQHLNHVPILG
jgi:AraC-like DNA-binding protein